MKTFDEKDLITWSNRDKAVIGNEYYFADSLIGMKSCINNNCAMYTLDYIAEENICAPFHCDNLNYACILPVDAVKEEKYRPLKSIKKLYELLNNGEFDMDEVECIYQLIDFTVHIKNKKTGKEYYSIITSVSKDIDDTYKILIHSAGYSLLSLFNTFDVEINGKWQPFGVLEK